VLNSLKTAMDATNAALLLITHDLGVIAGLADRVLVMYAGRPVEIGTAEDVFYKPSMPYTLGLLGSLPRLDSDGTERLRQIPGAPPSMMGDRIGCPFAPRCPLSTELCESVEPELTVVESVTSAPGEHMAACHYAEAVGRGDHGLVFSDGIVDSTVP
jgi:oligopeptide/dipeptide ABC transporter ATP-binding protein